MAKEEKQNGEAEGFIDNEVGLVDILFSTVHLSLKCTNGIIICKLYLNFSSVVHHR